jgi:hypothetical protein
MTFSLSSLLFSCFPSVLGTNALLCTLLYSTPHSSLLMWCSVYVGTSQCPSFDANYGSIYQNHTYIVCQLPQGQGTNNYVTVKVLTRATPTLTAAVVNYNGPVITSTSPTTYKTDGGTTFTISGSNFGVSNMPSSVTVNQVPCPFVGGYPSQSTIKCTLPSGQGLLQIVTVTISGQSANTTFNYSAPTISGITPSNGPTQGGTLIAISGSSLGTSGSVTIGGNPCVIQTGTQQHTQVICQAPQGTGGSQSVVVTVSAQSVSSFFIYDSPAVQSISPNNGPTKGGTIVTITGSSFDQANGTVTIAGSPCPVSTWSQSSITCI